MAVKAALVRGRARLRDADGADGGDLAAAATRAQLDRYAELFNAGDWDGVRALVGEDCRLDLVSKSQRRGKAVGAYFSRYAAEAIPVRVRVVKLDGALALAVYTTTDAKPAYFMLLATRDGHITTIRDFRYVPYIAAELDLSDFELLGD